MENILEILLNGLSTGTIYALLALGFVLIFKSTGVINFAQGELAMVGAFICYSLAMKARIPYFLALVAAMMLSAAVGWLVYRGFLRRMTGEPMFSTIMVTIGLASMISCAAGLIWGHDVYAIHSPFSNRTVSLGAVILSQGTVYTVGISVLAFAAFIRFFNRSQLGIALKGTAEDPDTAGLMGINVGRMHAAAWAVGAMAAAVAGIFLAEQSFVRIGMSHTGIKAMAAVILGGMESIPGAIVGGILIGIVEGLAANYLSGLELANFHFGDIKDVAAFAVMILALMIRPHGLFGKKKVERV